jgi:endoglucanase
MEETKKLLLEMIQKAGLSGYEVPIRDLIADAWEPLTNELSVSKIGSLHGLKHGQGTSPRKSILVATHMDAIGMMVNRVEGEFLHVTNVGGIDPRVVPGIPVRVHGREEIPAILVVPPNHTMPEDQREGAYSLTQLRVDTGLRANTLARIVRVGDLVSFDTRPLEIDGGFIAGHSLDNRTSVAVMTETLRLLLGRTHEWDVLAVATVQEETGLGGATTSAFELRPTLAVALDVTYGVGPGAAVQVAWKLDKGPSLDWGANTHPKLYAEFERIARDLEIPYQNGVYARHSGTDGYALQTSRQGIPTMVLSIPLRYMHTPVEMIATKDISRLARLLAEFITNLDDDFMELLRWDEDPHAEVK